MANYRTVSVTFWSDPKVDEDFTPEDKYFFLYLLTNTHTNICGCYELGIKQMARETGYNEETVKRLLKRMVLEHDVIRYCSETKEVLVLKWHKYNWTKSEDLLKKVKAVSEYIKHEPFKQYVYEIAQGHRTVVPPSHDGGGTSVSVSVSDSVSVNNINNNSINNNSINNTSSDDDEFAGMSEREIELAINFDAFWDKYPKKVEKKKARSIFMKLKPSTELFREMMQALDTQKRSAQWARGYAPNPTTWLNGERWNDKLTDPKPDKKVANYMQRDTVTDGFGMEYVDETFGTEYLRRN